MYKEKCVVNDFIGRTFPTPKGGLLTVIGVLPKEKGKILEYRCTCTLCTPDKELFPNDKEFLSNKYGLLRGALPCGCTSITKPTLEQEKVLMQRELDKDWSKYRVTDAYSNKGTTYYSLTCLVCKEKDQELWTEGSLEITKARYRANGVVCGCANTFKSYTEQQIMLRAERACTERGFILHGFVGEYNCGGTKMKLTNPSTNITWTSTSVDYLLHNPTMLCPEEYNKKKFRKTHSEWVDGWVGSGHFLKGTLFTDPLVKDGSLYYSYTCPVCSIDEYVLNGLCSGVFTARADALSCGNLPCRCSKAPRYTKDQTIYKLRSLCVEEGLTYIGLISQDEWRRDSKFKWRTSCGKLKETHIGSFIRRGVRDSPRGANGFYKERVDEWDTLYILDFAGQYLKVGRSFNVMQRIKQLRVASGIKDISIIKLVEGTHKDVYEVEQYIHSQLEEKGFYHRESLWSTETFTLDCLSALDNILAICDLKNTTVPCLLPL